MSNARRNMAFGKVNDFIVVVHNKHAPGDDEWDAYMQFNVAHSVEQGTIIRLLVFTEGGAPTAVQRRLMHSALSPSLAKAKHPGLIRVAVISPSTFVRGVATAMSLLDPVYRSFSPADIGAAYTYVGVPHTYISNIEALVAELKAQL